VNSAYALNFAKAIAAVMEQSVKKRMMASAVTVESAAAAGVQAPKCVQSQKRDIRSLSFTSFSQINRICLKESVSLRL